MTVDVSNDDGGSWTDLTGRFPGVPDHVSLWGLLIPIRRAFQQYVNLRPLKLFAGVDSPLKGLRIGNLMWRELHDFSPDCVVLVLASEHHDEADYIRDYEEFLEHLRDG